jgi:hypothetical protein
MFCRVIFHIEKSIRDLSRSGVKTFLITLWEASSRKMRRGAGSIHATKNLDNSVITQRSNA